MAVWGVRLLFAIIKSVHRFEGLGGLAGGLRLRFCPTLAKFVFVLVGRARGVRALPPSAAGPGGTAAAGVPAP